MDKWDIRPTPSADDPDRHILLIQGGPSDVAALLKKFGALMGRPEPAQASGFNLSLVLHKLKAAKKEKLDAWLRKAAPDGAPEAAEAPASKKPSLAPPPPTPEPTPAPPPPPMPVLEPPPSMPTLSPPPPMPVLEAPPASPAFGIPSLVPPPAEKTALVSLTPEPAAKLEPAPTPEPAPAPKPAPKPTQMPVLTPPPSTILEPASLPPPTSGPEYSIAVGLRADWSMESLLVGAYNRFAHAAVMSVVTSPGTMYNPLFLYGVPGTGKSHMLNAIGAALSKGLGGSVLLCTSGSRMSCAVNTAILRKTTAELDDRINNSKALLIDDIHLMALAEENKETLAKIFKSFFDRKAQVVITSLYPPRSLGALEEALKFSFSKGWSVDLKIPSPGAQKEIIGAAADRTHSGLSGDEITLLHGKLTQAGYSDMGLWLSRVTALKKLRENAGQPAVLQSMLDMIYEPTLGVPPGVPPIGAPAFQPAPPPPKAEAMAVITPKGTDGLGAFVASLFYEIGLKHGFEQVYRHALWESYDPSVPFGVPFMIGEMCRRAGVTRALVVGPPPESPLGPRSVELAHATRRILESFGVQMAWIPCAGIGLAAHYLNARLDFAGGAARS